MVFKNPNKIITGAKVGYFGYIFDSQFLILYQKVSNPNQFLIY